MEEEDDIAKFADFKVSASGSDDGVKESPEPTPPKEEVKEPVRSPDPKVAKTVEAPQPGDRLFASPLARKLAEDHNVSFLVSVEDVFFENCFCFPYS